MAEVVDFGLQQHKIKMDSRYFENVLSVVAGDTGRRIEVQLLDTNGMVQDTTGLNLRLNAEIAGKATFTDATLVDATTGKYQLDLSNGMFLAPGNWQFQWLITDSAGKKLHSFVFTGNVGSNISEGGSQATNFYLNLEDLKAMQDDLVNGTIDSSILETNITEKLTNLETQYAPKLTEVTAQLAQNEQEVSKLSTKVGTLGATSTFKGSATNADIMAKTGMSIGDEWFDSTNNQALRWNGSTWSIVGGSIKLGDESITTPKYAKKSLSPDKTTFIDELPTLNVFDKRAMTDGKRVYSTNGTIGNLSGYSVNEDLRAIKPATTFTRLKNGELAFYDSAGVFISGVVSGTKTFTTPTNVSTYRITCLTSDLDTQMMVEGTTLPTGYIPNYTNKLSDSIQVNSVVTDTLTGMLWDALGDSTTNTTYGNPYHQHIKDRTGIVPINYGVNQTSIAVREGLTNSMLERYLTMNSNADIVTVMGGRNDISYAVPIGSMSDRVNNTVYGACHLLFSGLIEKFKGKKIGVILPLQRSTDTATVINYINAIREVAEYYSLPVLDLYSHSGLTPRIQSIVDAYMPDGLHPNSEGHKIISRVIESWLRTL